MNEPLPRTIARPIPFRNGCAIGLSNRWRQGQYCTLLTEAGLVGCGIYDVKTAAEFGQAVAIARGTPQKPLVNPEDLLDAKIVDATPQAQALGVRIGMTGREAVELLLAATPAPPLTGGGP
ncbi:MAG TPA: YunC family protein [Gemmataceae bacterium]|nr:YunC family protein [Gemmataceae bacterium]